MQPPTYAARREHTSLGPMSATSAELDDASSSGRGDTRAALGAIIVWKVSADSRRVSTICASMMGPVQQRFLTKDGRAFGNGPDFTREAEGFQVFEESAADVSERRMPTEEADV